jgi:hypothetical protein
MADMIDAKEAKQVLGCDDDALNGHINGGAIRAQRIGGKLMVNKEDVIKVAADQEDGTIVLTGDSDNLHIDLGKVDDSTDTGTHSPSRNRSATDSITFGDELEVINFEDAKGTQEVSFDDSKRTMDLNFTDQNTAVMTAVDETQIGGTTAQLDTSHDGGPVAISTSSESRRSVRSNRIRIESAPVHPMWVAFMALTTLLLAFFVTPYFIMSSWPRGDDRDFAGNQVRGVDDNFWTSMASTLVGYSTEPSKDNFKRLNGDAEFVKNPDAPEFRYALYRGSLKVEGEKRDSFIIEKIENDGKLAVSKGAKFPIVEAKTSQGGIEIVEEVVDIGLTSAK